MLPAPSTTELSAFTGRAVDTYGTFVDQALAQATLLFGLRTGLTEMPADADLLQLAKNAILQMADSIYLEQPNAATVASPFQSETIGSYTYSKGSAAGKAKDGTETGLFWWDLALDMLATADVLTGGAVIYTDLVDVRTDTDGNAVLVTPADDAELIQPEIVISSN